MKNIVKYIMIALIAFATCSCNDFLEENPSNATYTFNAIEDIPGAQTALNGTYRLMTASSYYGRDMLIYGDYKGGDFGLTTSGIAGDALYFFTHNPSSGNYSGFWTQGYTILLQANNIIESIEAGKVPAQGTSEEKKVKDIHGQALAIRALVHFDLTRLYGYPYAKDNGASWGVPIADKTLRSDDQLRRNTVAECYTQIIADLTSAISLLSDDKKVGAINLYGAKALLARAYLYKHDWENAYTTAKSIIDDNKYIAYTATNWVESWGKQDASESIFELIVRPLENDLGSTSPRAYFAPRNMKGLNGRGELGPIMVSDIFLNDFTDNPAHSADARMAIFGLDEFGNGKNSASASIPGRKGWMMKYEGDGKNPASAVNVKVIRLTEVLMIAAEAALKKQTKDIDNAVIWINKVRSRNPSLTDLTNSEPINNLLVEIDFQRRVDLIGEGHRFFDVLRNNGTISYVDGGFWTQLPNGGRGSTVDWNFYKIVLPIYINELNANPNIRDQQNPGADYQ